jgi:uncharacterized protein (TIGR00255 family)
MIKSMTGFGRCEITENNKKLTIEIKSVNHRYFDVSIKMTKKFMFFESAIRNILKEYAVRGKIDIYLTYEDMSGTDENIKYNESLAREYYNYYDTISKTFNLKNDLTTAILARCPDVITMEEADMDEEEILKLIEKTLKGACEMFVETRTREGEHLKTDMLLKLSSMTDCLREIEERSPLILSEYRQKLLDKLHEVMDNTQIDENRIASEMVIFADKLSVDEETVRLKSHIEHMKKDLLAGGEQGRKLDFVAQEMNREANTILSKANDITISNLAIALKTDIEKIREQIQNIE